MVQQLGVTVHYTFLEILLSLGLQKLNSFSNRED